MQEKEQEYYCQNCGSKLEQYVYDKHCLLLCLRCQENDNNDRINNS